MCRPTHSKRSLFPLERERKYLETETKTFVKSSLSGYVYSCNDFEDQQSGKGIPRRKSLKQDDCLCSHEISIEDVNKAARDGDLHLLDHLHTKRCDLIKDEEDTFIYEMNDRFILNRTHVQITGNAVIGGHMKVLEWCRNKGLQWGKQLCRKAAERGDIKMLKFLRENDCPWGVNPLREACRNGYVDVIEWAIINGCPLDIWDVAEACKKGEVKVVAYVLENEILRPHSWLCAAAAGAGELEMLKWLHENRCPWDETTASAAFNNNELDVLEWALENGCPFEV